jgi:hypothetical protein
MSSFAAIVVAATAALGQVENQQAENHKKLDEALGWLVGTWEYSFPNAEAETPKQVQKIEWILNGAYLRCSNCEEGGTEPNGILIMGWNTENEEVRGWLFRAGDNGTVSYGVGKLAPDGVLVWKVYKEQGTQQQSNLTRTWKKVDNQTVSDKFDFREVLRFDDFEMTWKRKN